MATDTSERGLERLIEPVAADNALSPSWTAFRTSSSRSTPVRRTSLAGSRPRGELITRTIRAQVIDEQAPPKMRLTCRSGPARQRTVVDGLGSELATERRKPLQ